MDHVKLSRKWPVLFVLALMPFMATMDGSATAIAMPAISDSLQVNTEAAQLVQIVFFTAVACTTLLFGRLGDARGKSKIFLAGVALFTLGSCLSALAQNFTMLLCARVIEALGASAALAVGQGIVTEAFPPQWRGRALGIVGMAVALGAVAGPLLGGMLLSAYGWHAIYLVNLPVGIAVFFLGLWALPRGAAQKAPVDAKGAILIALPVLLFFTALLGGQRTGYGQPYIPVLFVASAVLLVVFLLAEKRSAAPLLDLSMFKNPLFSISLVCMAVQFLAVSSMGVIEPYYLEDIRSIDASGVGWITAGMSIAMAVSSPLGGWISDKFGPKRITLIGAGLVAAALFMLAMQSAGTPVGMLVVFSALLGLGSGLFNSPNNSILMSTATKETFGITGSMAAFTRSFSNTAGSTASTVLFYTMMSGTLGYKVNTFDAGQPGAFVSSMQGVYLASALVMLGCVALCVWRMLRKDGGAQKAGG